MADEARIRLYFLIAESMFRVLISEAVGYESVTVRQLYLPVLAPTSGPSSDTPPLPVCRG
jgi:hypothetical protein